MKFFISIFIVTLFTICVIVNANEDCKGTQSGAEYQYEIDNKGNAEATYSLYFLNGGSTCYINLEIKFVPETLINFAEFSDSFSTVKQVNIEHIENNTKTLISVLPYVITLNKGDTYLTQIKFKWNEYVKKFNDDYEINQKFTMSPDANSTTIKFMLKTGPGPFNKPKIIDILPSPKTVEKDGFYTFTWYLNNPISEIQVVPIQIKYKYATDWFFILWTISTLVSGLLLKILWDNKKDLVTKIRSLLKKAS